MTITIETDEIGEEFLVDQYGRHVESLSALLHQADLEEIGIDVSKRDAMMMAGHLKFAIDELKSLEKEAAEATDPIKWGKAANKIPGQQMGIHGYQEALAKAKLSQERGLRNLEKIKERIAAIRAAT